jgi:energy-coupling factor transporter ATP-binding protein EcfA2
MIIGICGRQGSGKDTIASLINKITNNRFEVKRFSSKLKECAGILLGVPVELFEDRKFKESYIPQYDMTVRELLQKFGTDLVRETVHPNLWIESTLLGYTNQDWIISDVRFINECDSIKSRGGVIVKAIRKTKHDNHPSENEIDFITPDYEIDNNGSFFDLQFCVNRMMNDIAVF